MQTVPVFPIFRHLTLADKDWFEEFYGDFPKYADFSFGNFVIWQGAENNLQISQLNGNLVFMDKPYYLDDQIMLNFFGNKKVTETMNALFKFQKSQHAEQELIGIPEFIIENIAEKDRYVITEDKNNAEYILDTKKLSDLEGHDLQSVRRYVSKFIKATDNDFTVVTSDMDSPGSRTKLEQTIESWEKSFATNDSAEKERPVMQRMFAVSEELGYKSVSIYVHGILTALVVYRPISTDTVVLNHHKTNYAYEGLSVALIHEAAKALSQQGFKYINYEQDLGIEGLRTFKQKLKPLFMLKKYTIRPRQ